MCLRFSLTSYLVALVLIVSSSSLEGFSSGEALPPPVNDNCADAIPIPISGSGFDYGAFISSTSDLTTATGEVGEYFNVISHVKSVWYEFTVPTHRSLTVELSGSNLSNVAITLYTPDNCLPGLSNHSGTGEANNGTSINNSCSFLGTYRVQVTGLANSVASVFVIITLSCPSDLVWSLYDCPDDAYLFNSGNPLPFTPFSSSTGTYSIGCQSLEEINEAVCLPITNIEDYLQSTWYVFTTGNEVDLLAFDFIVDSSNDTVGYRLFEGNVRDIDPGLLPQLECGLAKKSSILRYIEFPCLLKPNTTYSLSLIFHKEYIYGIDLRARQRGVSTTGWPRPILPPIMASNQLGSLPGSPAGTVTNWLDRFDCNAFIIDNICPPANPASGEVIIGPNTLDLSTWATFTLSTDANVNFRFTAYHSGRYHTRIFSKTLNANCPSPNPDPAATELYFEFTGLSAEYLCMRAGDYSIQVLSNSGDPTPSNTSFEHAMGNGNLGTSFTLEFKVTSLSNMGLFRLNATGQFDAINGLNALQNNIRYPSIPAVFVCDNTVLPDNMTCQNITKAIYREVHIGDANGNGTEDEGLLTMSKLLTDDGAGPEITYSFYQGDANQLATTAGTHLEGQEIPGLIDYPGFCIDEEDNTYIPLGIDSFCVCVTPGTYSLASFGNVEHVGKGDQPGFKFNVFKTIHDSRQNAELVVIGGIPGTYNSGPDIFSCSDNLDTMPPCGRRKKLVYREFFLASSAIVSIAEIGNSTSLLSLFSGRASDLTDNLTLLSGCNISILNMLDPCTPLQGGQWYTIVSYGEGPNFTDNRVWNPAGFSSSEYMGDPRDVGKTTRISITLEETITPNYNLPGKAHHAGITDWTTQPLANPNAVSWKLYPFPSDTFCAPDTPFIPNGIISCEPGYNRIAFYVFEITKPSFIQIRNVDISYYTEIFPFDVSAQPGSLLNVAPVYQCLKTDDDFRQICDLPPGKYTIAIFANDSHMGQSISPIIYVDEVALSRFDHVWNAYDFDFVPPTNVYVDRKLNDVHPVWASQAPSRDIFYCTTGATTNDPTETLCNTQINELIYAEPVNVPKPLFLPNQPSSPFAQPWRNLWYTFKLSGTGSCTIKADVLSGVNSRPLIAVYESDVNATIPWSSLQTLLSGQNDTIINGLEFVGDNITSLCNASGNILFNKNGCIRDSVRYFVVLSFDADNGPAFPNQAISLSIKYDGKPTYYASYDERISANVVNGLVETAPPYSSIPLTPGSTFVSTDFSLDCYTPNANDPISALGCLYKGKSAWFKFEVTTPGQFYTALEEQAGSTGWFADRRDVTVWRESSPGSVLTDELSLSLEYDQLGQHNWLGNCIEPGIYYLLVRRCLSIDTTQSYRVVIRLIDSPGDFCSNALPITVPDFTPASATVIPDCHTIGTDFGETTTLGMGCLYEAVPQKTSWFRATVTAGPKMDITFQLNEDLTGADINQLSYRVLFGSCGALTPIACSSIGSNKITQRCLAPGDYYIQVAMPERVGNTAVEGSLGITVTAEPNDDPDCEPQDFTLPLANFTFTSDCQTVSFINLSTSGTDITYLWEFPDGTSNETNPVWVPPSGASTYTITLSVTNVALNKSSSTTQTITVNNTFPDYTELADTVICNESGPVFLDATVMGATYIWDDGTTSPTRVIDVAGSYWVDITVDECELRDSVVVEDINATLTIDLTLCPNASITLNGQVFDINKPAGMVILQNAHPSGCDSILTVDLSFYPTLNTQHSRTICQGETFSFNNQNLTQSGIYNDTLVSSNGCDSMVTLTLTVTPQQIFSHDISGCVGSSLILIPATTGANYEWNNGAITNSFSVETQGTYSVSVSDIDPCIIAVETFTVTFGELSPPDVTVPNPVCQGSDVLLFATGSTGEYRWYDQVTGGNLLGTGSSLSISNVVADTTIYVEAFQAGLDSCVSERIPVTVTISAEPVQITSVDTVVCAGSSFTLPWGEEVTPVTAASFTNVSTYMVNGCDSLILTVNITVEHLEIQYDLSDYAGFGVTCYGSEDGFILVDVLNGTSPYQFLWNTGDTTSVLSEIPAGTYTITVTSANGCVVFGSGILSEPPALDLIAEKTDLTCFDAADGTISAMISGGVPAYNFNLNGGATQLNPEFENLLSGNYTLLAIDSRGCIDSVKLDLTEPAEIVLDLIAVSPPCPSDIPTGSISALAWGGQPPIMFSIENGAYSSQSDFSQLSAGLYEVSAQDAAGCRVSEEIEVMSTISLPLTMPSILTVQLGDSVQLIPQIGFLADSIHWSPSLGLSCIDCPEPWAKPDQSTEYQLTVWSTEGCLVSGTIQLNVNFKLRIYIPNVFTPDANSVNDEFSVYAKKEVQIIRSLSVFDRWGNGVWQAQNFIPDGSTGWNGFSRSKPMPAGVYVWICEVELIDGTVEVLTGDVTLLR